MVSMRRICTLLFFVFYISCNAQEKKAYTDFIEEIISQRDVYKTEYAEANSSKKQEIIINARTYLISKMTTELFPYWYGTQWDFNGTTRTPQNGKIACGYFVTNILTDVGFNIPRVKWAQSASEVFIKKLSYGDIQRFSNKSIATIEQHLLKSGDGLYLVGLDSHTGFIYVKGDQIRFIHADYYEPEIGVVSEEIDSHSPIRDSNYRVIGKLMSDKMIISWIQKQAIR